RITPSTGPSMFWKLTLSSGDLLPRQRQSLRFAEPASSAQVHGERSNWVARLGGCFEVRGRAMLHPRIPTGYLLLTLPLSRERVPVGERRCQKEQLARSEEHTSELQSHLN